MKIKKIKYIKNIATYSNFQWDSNTKEFTQYNFFYGWNYSGKTTLSRIFRFVESKNIPSDFAETQFSIETEKGVITQNSLSNDYLIRVYNEDFVEENFQWRNEKASIEPVLILGKKSIELEKILSNLTKNKEQKENNKIECEKEKSRLENLLNNNLTDKASEIRNILGITNPREFDKNELNNNIEAIKEKYHTFLLNENEKNTKLELYRSKKLEKIELQNPKLKLSNFSKEVTTILSKQVTAHKIIKKLKDNPKLANWVKEGIGFHQNETHCQFCGNKLSDSLLDDLNKHFSKEFDNLMNEINEIKNQISEHIKEIEKLYLPDKSRLFDDLQYEYQNITTQVNDFKERYTNSLGTLIDELNKKKEKPFDSLKFQSQVNNAESDFEKLLQKIDGLIKQHNKKADNFEREKQDTKTSLINHYVAEFIKEKDYLKKLEGINNKEGEINKLQGEIDELSRKIEEINKQIKAEAIGAEKINEYLKQFFANDNLKVQLTNENKYKLYRNNKLAKNLSTGEKNIISLIYFFAKLEEKDFDFNNGIIFIDDPVSSLDSNHIFKVYSFISEKLKNCGQLFITTHNFDFFNLLKDTVRYDFKSNGNFYLIKKIKTDGMDSSTIDNLPVLLLKFKSEYNYLFSILKSFTELNDKSNFELLYILPNILRRFFENYLFIKYPDGKKFKDKVNKFLKQAKTNEKLQALKLMDEYSHEENPTHSQKFPDIEEIESAVSFILKEIKDKDREHYKALEESLSISN